MKILKLTVILMILHYGIFAQITLRNIFEKQYSLEYVKKNLTPLSEWNPYPKTASEWKTAVPDSILTILVKEGEKALTYKFEPISASTSLDFVRSGDRERHSKISFGKRNILIQLILAESVEDKGRFTEAILNGIWSICEESYWGVPAHIGGTGLPNVENPIVDLFSAETASVLGMADYFMGEKLDKINKLIRKRIYYETDRRIFTPLQKNSDKYGWMSKTKPVNNWNPWIMSNWILSNLLLEKNETRRAEMLYGAMVGLDAYLNSLGEDGGCDEGPSYWFAAGGSVYDCLELLEKSTNNAVKIYQNQLIQKMASYVYKTHISKDYFVNFADADPKLRPDGLMLYRFGKALNDDKMIQFGKWAFDAFPNYKTDGFQRMRRVENLLTIQKIDKSPSSYQAVRDAYVSDIQVLTARASNGLFLATHGGHNEESHNHNDVGDFIIYLNGQPMIVDAGRGNYTARTFSSHRYELWFTQSEYHNLPIINGFGQKAGRVFEAKNVKSITNEKEASLFMNIATAYPSEAGVLNWERNVKLNREKNQVELTDVYELSAQPKSLQQVFMSICEVDISEKGKVKLTGENNAKLTLQYDASLWTVTTDKPSTEGMEYESFKTKWNNHQVTRVLLTKKALSNKGKYQFNFVVAH
ncbi:hypothetical protein ABID42_003418 [Arcicella rosea]|uniref:heparinase II/III domain-containing protein n=1 Tax=Arcicella rosea TaxID=502909 RepID=UPI00345DDD44